MFRIRSTGEIVTESGFRSLHSTTSFPVVLTPDIVNAFGADPVLEGAQPTLTENQYSRYVGVVQDKNKNWVKTHEAVDYTAEEIAARKQQERESMVVSPLQAKAALMYANLLSTVESYVADANTDPIVKLAWNNAQEYKRLSPMIVAITTQLNITDQQADALFANAKSIVV